MRDPLTHVELIRTDAMRRAPIGATEATVNYRSTLDDRMDLEKRFVAWLLKPIQSLVGRARRLGAGVARHSDGASDAHLLALDQLRHSDRVATLARLASAVAHELGNPLNVIELRAQLISSGEAATLPQAQHNARIILEQARRMTRIIDEVLAVSRTQPAKREPVDLVGVVHKAIALTEHVATHHRAVVVFDAPPGVEIDGDADKLLQIIVNLLVNGIQAMPGGGTISLSFEDESRAPVDDPIGPHRAYACIDVRDRGVGIAPALLSKVFDPFFSTRSVEGGTGLGLSVAQGIAREHEGWISATSEIGRGSSFQVHLPKRRGRIDDPQGRHDRHDGRHEGRHDGR